MKKLIALALIVMLSLSYCEAAIITLRNGKKIQGDLLVNNSEVVIVRDNLGARFQYPADEVMSVESGESSTQTDSVQIEEKKPQGKKITFLLGLGEGVGVVPNEQVGNMFTGELLIGSRYIGRKSIFLGGGLSVNTIFVKGVTNYAFLPLQVAVKVPFLDGKHSPFVGANIGYGFAMNRGCTGGVFTSAEIGYRYVATSRINLYAGVRVQFQQATITGQTTVGETTFNDHTGRNFVLIGAHFGFSF